MAERLKSFFHGIAGLFHPSGEEGTKSKMSNVVHLISLDDLDRAIALSEERPVFIYKHSTACPVCSRTYRAFHHYAEAVGPDADLLFTEVYVIEHRDVSNEVASRLGVMHQSPQLLLVSGRKAIWNVSHFDITREAMDEALAAQHG